MEPVLWMKDVSLRDREGRVLLDLPALAVMPGERVRALAQRERFAALARLAGGLVRPERGEVILRGGAGYLPAEPGSWEDMTVLENAALPLTAAGVPRREREQRAMDTLSALGIGYAAHAYPGSLSPCEGRLAALARALVGSPTLLLMEEPAFMLDEKETDRFFRAWERLWQRDRFAVLFCAWDGGSPAADRTVTLGREHTGGQML